MYRFNVSSFDDTLSQNYTWPVTSSCGTSRATRTRLCRAYRDVRVAPCCPTRATRHVTTFSCVKMHKLDSVSCRDVMWRVKWNLGISIAHALLAEEKSWRAVSRVSSSTALHARLDKPDTRASRDVTWRAKWNLCFSAHALTESEIFALHKTRNSCRAQLKRTQNAWKQTEMSTICRPINNYIEKTAYSLSNVV